MPCGGIYPINVSNLQSIEGSIVNAGAICWQCSKNDPPPDHWCEEWDTPIHGTCVKEFLETDEGKIVISHRHEIVVHINGVTEVLFEEGQ